MRRHRIAVLLSTIFPFVGIIVTGIIYYKNLQVLNKRRTILEKIQRLQDDLTFVPVIFVKVDKACEVCKEYGPSVWSISVSSLDIKAVVCEQCFRDTHEITSLEELRDF